MGAFILSVSHDGFHALAVVEDALAQTQIFGRNLQKLVVGKELKALELPGLWNGAMSDWNTVFVEVPLTTFNPVKTVNDLLREQHQ